MAFDRDQRYWSVPELQAEITAYQAGFATAAERAGPSFSSAGTAPGAPPPPPRWLQAVPPLTTKLSFPAQIRRCQILNLAMRVKSIPHQSSIFFMGG